MKTWLAFLFFFGCILMIRAQDKDCLLGLVGSSGETIIQVFQLNEEQIRKMNEWKAEWGVTNKVFEEEIAQLFDSEEQSTMKELEVVAAKYKVLKDNLVAVSREYDQKLLRLFNQKQYDRYIELCAEANRNPLPVLPQPPPEKEPE